ncbi:inverse autotransporter beta domain-containing protein [Xenorhabdus bovienii]|uniref:Putative invasin n=1 Tax=Xenorhabdus bovienii TaxID=40576 RepID=A0A0B6X5L0_XENBV|nr:inverse autotransporter beta-barrel domain-containing protein [Xenorhabdus bovienii]CDM87639.1 putative invasin [Xenorhabdus bovienii]
MSSYIRKAIGFFIFICALVMLSILMNAFADGKDNVDIFISESSKKRINENTNDTSESDAKNLIARNIQTVGNILSSSPSDLAEQAKSYTLGKFNSTVSSEAKKWLSQFGTARINFGLDKKGTLENNSLDLLLPLYDNKADWLLFSQLGYRNKDSRNTINVGLGGRYFYQNWMYGMNTFYDHDLTGNNQRLGLGGEIWGDYIKLSANAYYRLSELQKSRNFKNYHERPANGYDINGEFFLPVYPNLGAKLTYEQYFGDNVTLFNRNTRQKNPSLAKLGLTYTPIPLITMGVDYKQGESGHTETQFLANFNYKLGVPLSAQLSPENVASMRTLTGSRYDLVERNNNIVLDHIKQSTIQLSIPQSLIGYSHEEKTISTTNNPDNKVELQDNKEFIKNGGKINVKGNQIFITFPTYQLSHSETNNYPVNFSVFENSTVKTASNNGIMTLIVRPFVVKEKEVSPIETLPADGKKTYLFTPVITYDAVGNQPLAQVTLDNVQWTTEPEIGEKSGLQWGKPEKTSKTNEKGQLQAALTSTKPIKDVKVFLQMDGMPKTQVGTVSFGEDISRFQLGEINISLPNNMKTPLTADGVQAYTYKAVVLDGKNRVPPNTSIADIKWDHDHKEISTLKLVPDGDKTDSEGQLIATLTSSEPVNHVTVTLSIEGHPEKPAGRVSFEPAEISLKHSPSGPILVGETYTVKATSNDKDSPKNLPITWDFDAPQYDKVTYDYTAGPSEATFSSSVEQVVTVKAAINGSLSSQTDLVFNSPSIENIMLSPETPNGTIPPGESYKFIATVFGADGKTLYSGSTIPFEWSIKLPTDAEKAGLSLSPSGKVTAVSDGILNAELTSKKDTSAVTAAEVCLTIVKAPQSPTTHKCIDSINFKSPPVDFDITSVEVHKVVVDGIEKPFDPQKPLLGNGADKYKYRALITKKGSKDQEKIANHTFNGVEWTRNQRQIDNKYLPKPETISLKTDDDGYLYATLDSNVGVGNEKDIEKTFIKVTLTIPSELPSGEPRSKDSANLVNFTPMPKPAVLFVYNQYNENKNIIFKEPHPYNYFESLNAELRDLHEPEKNFNQTEVIYSASDKKTIFAVLLSLGENNKGPIKFYAPGSATLKATINKDDGRIYLYEYKINIKKYPALPNDTGGENQINIYGYHTADSPAICELSNTPPGSAGFGESITFSVQDVSSSIGGVTALSNEFKNLNDWGFFHPEQTQADSKTIQYKLNNGPNKYVIFNPTTDKENTEINASGLLICETNTKKSN